MASWPSCVQDTAPVTVLGTLSRQDGGELEREQDPVEWPGSDPKGDPMPVQELTCPLMWQRDSQRG